MKHYKRPVEKGRSIVLGFMFVLAGTLLLAFNAEILNASLKPILISWQMLIIALGLANLFSARKLFLGIMMMATGTLFLIPKIMPVSNVFINHFWPVLIILAGILIIIYWNRRTISIESRDIKLATDNKNIESKSYLDNYKSEDQIHEINIFSGSKRNLNNNFKGGEIICIFGGSELNLSQCTLSDKETVIETICVFGGLKLIIPNDWNVKIDMVSILGGFTDERYNVSSNNDKRLHIKGVAIFGGGEIKTS